MRSIKKSIFLLIVTFLAIGVTETSAQEKVKDKNFKSIGGEEHNLSIYGVKIGMDVPTALQSVFVNAKRQPGKEKPDALQKEGKGKKDIRVLYNNLPKGVMQIVFAEGKYVKEISLNYKNKLNIDDLRLASSSDIGTASSGQRFDDRYTIGFVDNKKQEKLWWRFEEVDSEYEVRLSFRSGNILKDSSLWWQSVVQKSIVIKRGDEKKFKKAMKKKK